MPILIRSLLALIAGAQLPLAFAPFNLHVIAFIAPTLLLALWLYSSPKQALWYGFLFGIACFGFGISWVHISIHQFGNAPLAIAILMTALLVIYLALFPALQGYLLTKFFPKNNLSKLLLAFPASWVLFAWIRGWFLSGFPWLFLGYSQLSSPLRGIAPIFGIYGVSFAVALTCGAIVALFVMKKLRYILFAVVMVAVVWLGSFLLIHVHWTKPEGKLIKVSLIQGNVSQQDKWQHIKLDSILTLYKDLSAKHWDSKLIVWPEAAVPIFSWEAQPYLTNMDRLAKKYNTTIITGIPIETKRPGRYYNGIISLGQNHNIYLKRHLVPFGEYPMLAPLSTWIIKFFNIPLSNFTPGPKKQPPFIANNINIAPSICYETVYPTEILSYLPKAEVLVNVTDDSWFGTSIAAHQQLQMAQMRSLETGRYYLVATNTGITAIIKPSGQLQARAPTFKQFVLTGTIYPMTGSTPWIKFGYYLWLILAGIAIIGAIIFQSLPTTMIYKSRILSKS